MLSKSALSALLTAGLMFGAAAAQNTLSYQVKPNGIFTSGFTTMFDNIESRLALTAKQKPLYVQWQAVVLATAKHYEPVYAKSPEDMPLMERIAWEQQKHLNRAEALNAEMPALSALRDSLTAKQKASFDAAVLEMHFPKAGVAIMRMMPDDPLTLSGTVTTIYSSD